MTSVTASPIPNSMPILVKTSVLPPPCSILDTSLPSNSHFYHCVSAHSNGSFVNWQLTSGEHDGSDGAGRKRYDDCGCTADDDEVQTMNDKLSGNGRGRSLYRASSEDISTQTSKMNEITHLPLSAASTDLLSPFLEENIKFKFLAARGHLGLCQLLRSAFEGAAVMRWSPSSPTFPHPSSETYERMKFVSY